MEIDKQKYCLIVYSDIYGLFPTGYAEKIYFKGRPMKIDPHEEIFLTENNVKLTYDPHYKKHIVQAQVYDRYELTLLARENYNIDTLKYAQSIQIYGFADKQTFYPVIEEITRQRTGGTAFQEIKITFYDTNTENYYNGYPVMNNLRSDILINRGYSAANLTKVSLVPLTHPTWVTQYDYYTAFYTVSKNKAENKQETELNGRQYPTRITAKKQKEITLYLTESDQHNFMHYVQLCNSYNGKVEIKENGGASPMQYELPDVESEEVKGAVDLWKVKLTLVYTITNNLTYAT